MSSMSSPSESPMSSSLAQSPHTTRAPSVPYSSPRKSSFLHTEHTIPAYSGSRGSGSGAAKRRLQVYFSLIFTPFPAKQLTFRNYFGIMQM